jgi:hypothetical protein
MHTEDQSDLANIQALRSSIRSSITTIMCLNQFTLAHFSAIGFRPGGATA